MSKIKREHKIIEGIECAECSKCKRYQPLKFFGKKASTSDGLQSHCKQCISEYTKLKSEERKPYMKKYTEDNKEVLSQKRREYDKKNKKKIAEKRKDYFKLYRDSHKEQYKKWFVDYYKKEEVKEAYRNHCRKRRVRLKNNISIADKKDFEECLKFFDCKDAYTGKEMEIPSVDHFIPISKGGSHTKHNLIPCDKHINSSKHASDFEIWYRKQTFFSEKRLKKIYKWVGYDEKTKAQQITLN